MSDRNGVNKFAMRRRDSDGRWWCWRVYAEIGFEGGWYPETAQPDDTPGMLPDKLPWLGPGHCEACVGLRAEHDELQTEVSELQTEVSKLQKEAGELRAQLAPLLWLARTARQLVRGTA